MRHIVVDVKGKHRELRPHKIRFNHNPRFESNSYLSEMIDNYCC